MGGSQGETRKQLQGVAGTANQAYQGLQTGPTPLEKEFNPISQGMYNTYQTGMGQNMQDYGNIMGGYNQFSQGLGGPTKFNYQTINAPRPGELNESYGTLRSALPGYQQFAQTGGYSPTDIQELRARGTSPIRAAYGNTMMELDRARSLGGGYSPGYTAALSRAQTELPGQMADAMTGVNAKLAEDIRQGQLSGLGGMAGIGSEMGGLSSAEAGRQLQAGLANQEANLRAQGMDEASLQNLRQNQLRGLQGQTGLYGTSPAMAGLFGQQALEAYQQRNQQQQMRNQLGLGLLGTQVQAYAHQPQTTPWWQQALGAASQFISPFGMPNMGGGNSNPGGGGYYDPYGNFSPGPANPSGYFGGEPDLGGSNNWSGLPGYGTELPNYGEP